MPTSEAGSRWDNICKSIDQWLIDNIQTGLSTSVFLQDQHVPSSVIEALTRYVMATINDLGQVGEFTRGGAGQTASMHEVVLDLNCYEKSDAANTTQTNRYTLDTLVTNIKQLFNPKSTSIVVLDWDTVGAPQVGIMRFGRIPDLVVRHDAESIGVRQIDIRAVMHYMEVLND